MKPNEVVFHVAGEGGSIALYGLRADSGWLFSFNFIDSSTALPSKTSTMSHTNVVSEWQGALELLADRAWHMLKPLCVHPEFREDIFNALVARELVPGGGGKSRHRQRWEELCTSLPRGSTPEDLSNYQVEENVHSSAGWLYGLVDD